MLACRKALFEKAIKENTFFCELCEYPGETIQEFKRVMERNQGHEFSTVPFSL